MSPCITRFFRDRVFTLLPTIIVADGMRVTEAILFLLIWTTSKAIERKMVRQVKSIERFRAELKNSVSYDEWFYGCCLTA